MPTDPQGYPLVAYERISDGQVMFQVLSDGTVVLANGTTIGGSSSQGINITDNFGNSLLMNSSGIAVTPGPNLPVTVKGKTNLLAMGGGPLYIQFPSLKLVSATSALLPAGTTVLATGAAGKKTFIDVRYTNLTGAPITMNSDFIDENNNIFPNQLGLSCPAHAAGAGTGQFGGQAIFAGIPILEAGQSLRLNTVSAPNLSMFTQIWTMDTTEPIRTLRTNNIISGDNLIYTCPAGKTAVIYSSSGNQPRMGMVNQSGFTVTYTIYVVRNGQTKGQLNQFISNFTQANNTSNSASFSPSSLMTFTPGDSLVLNANQAGGQQFYVFYLIEMPLN